MAAEPPINIIVTNHGLIDAYDATLVVPESDTYEIIPLFDKIDTIHALSSVAIPCSVRNKKIVKAIQMATANREYRIDTIVSHFYITRKKTTFVDTTIYIPVSHWEEDTVYESTTRYDTIYYVIPKIETDTVETIVEYILCAYVDVADTLIITTKSTKYIYGSCDNVKYKLYATYRCNGEGHYVQTGTVQEWLDCDEEDDDDGNGDDGGSGNGGGNGNGEVGDPTSPSPGPSPRPQPNPSLDERPTTPNPLRPGGNLLAILPTRLGLPGFNFSFNRPVVIIDQECEPCWQRVAKDGVDCLGSIALTSRYRHLTNEAIRYREIHTNLKRELRAGDMTQITKEDIRGLYNATQTSIQHSNNAAIYSHAGHINDARSIVYDMLENDYGKGTIDVIAAGVGYINPVAGTTITCVNDAVDALVYCIHNDRIEIPIDSIPISNDDTILFHTCKETTVRYYDTIINIVHRYFNDTSSNVIPTREMEMSIMRYLVTTDSAVVEQIERVIDTTYLSIISIATLQHYVNKWNRTVDYLRRGWVNPSMVPTGLSLDYLYLDTNTTFALVDMEMNALEHGFGSIEEMFAYTLDYLATYPAKQSVCAGVSLLLSQEAAMTREAFEGVLSIKNPSDTSALQDLVIAFEVTDTNGNDCSDRFSINVISRKGFDNNGNIANGGTGTVTVQFVPLLSAAPDVPIPYYFGGTVEYTNPYTRQPETDALLATCLTVNPSPHLTLDYFVPQNIIADDPLTSPLVEKAIPSIVALKIVNDGKNTAHDIRLSSVQPSITENSQGLAVSFSMLNSYRDGIQTSIATQDIMLGNMDTGDIHILEYELQSSLMGTLSVNSIDVIHTGTTNDKDLSLVSARAHSLVKAVFQILLP